MPLTFATAGKPCKVVKITGSGDTRLFLEKLGCVVNTEITVINEVDGNLIVNIKGSRVAIGKELANKIHIA